MTSNDHLSEADMNWLEERMKTCNLGIPEKSFIYGYLTLAFHVDPLIIGSDAISSNSLLIRLAAIWFIGMCGRDGSEDVSALDIVINVPEYKFDDKRVTFEAIAALGKIPPLQSYAERDNP